MKKYEYYQPLTLSEAHGIMEKFKGRAKYIAGGTDLMIRVKHGIVEPEALLSLRGLKELQGFEYDGALRLGSMTLFRELERKSLDCGSFSGPCRRRFRTGQPAGEKCGDPGRQPVQCGAIRGLCSPSAGHGCGVDPGRPGRGPAGACGGIFYGTWKKLP